ncbi:MAG: transglutaminaseTgpA domain-containing protein [Caldilineaceae bacterium]
MMTMVASSQSYASAKRPFSVAQTVYFQDGALLTGLLTAALYLLLAITLAVDHHAATLPLFGLVAVSAWLLGLLMAYSRFDGYFVFSYSILAGLPWLFILIGIGVDDNGLTPPFDKIPDFTSRHFQIVLFHLLNGLADLQKLNFTDNPYAFIFAICLLIWWLTYFGVWTIVRYGATWRMVIPASAVVIVSTVNTPRATANFLIPFLLIALVLLIHTNLAEQQRRWRAQFIYFQPTIALSFWRNGVLYSLLVLAVAWLPPGVGQLLHWSWAGFPPLGLAQSLSANATFPNELHLGGPRHLDDRPLFTVLTGSHPRTPYWRAVVYDTFTGAGWLNTARDEQMIGPNLPIPEERTAERTPFPQRVTLLETPGNSIIGAPDIVQVSLPVTAVIRSTDDQAAEVMLQSRQPLQPGDSYTVVSQVTDVTEQALRTAGVAYPAGVLELYDQLSTPLSPRVTALVQQVIVDQATVYDKVKAIEQYLRTFPYNENIQAPPAQRNPVEYFLFDIQQGYCDYYATAMAVMLRSLHIPARVVSGYASGQFDPASNLYTVRAQDAHTWVEVYFPRYGWIEFEPTASKHEIERTPLSASPVSPLPAPSVAQPTAKPPPTYRPTAPTLKAPNALRGNLSKLGFTHPSGWLWIMAPLLLLGFTLWGWWRRRWGRSFRWTPELPALLYAQMGESFTRLGVRSRIQDTPYEQARRFARRLPAGRPLIRQITEAYVHHRFSRPVEQTEQATGVIPSSSAELGETGRQLQRLLWRAWLRKGIEKVWSQPTLRFTLRER